MENLNTHKFSKSGAEVLENSINKKEGGYMPKSKNSSAKDETTKQVSTEDKSASNRNTSPENGEEIINKSAYELVAEKLKDLPIKVPAEVEELNNKIVQLENRKSELIGLKKQLRDEIRPIAETNADKLLGKNNRIEASPETKHVSRVKIGLIDAEVIRINESQRDLKSKLAKITRERIYMIQNIKNSLNARSESYMSRNYTSIKKRLAKILNDTIENDADMKEQLLKIKNVQGTELFGEEVAEYLKNLNYRLSVLCTTQKKYSDETLKMIRSALDNWNPKKNFDFNEFIK